MHIMFTIYMICIHMYIYIHIYIHTYIYIYREREREYAIACKLSCLSLIGLRYASKGN